MFLSSTVQKRIVAALILVSAVVGAAFTWTLYAEWRRRQATEELLAAIQSGDLPSIARVVRASKKSGLGDPAAAKLIGLLKSVSVGDIQRGAFHALVALDPQKAARIELDPGLHPWAIDSSGQSVNEKLELEIGGFVEVEWGGSWWAGKVLALEPDGMVRIHYLGWESRFDEAVPPERLRVPVSF